LFDSLTDEYSVLKTRGYAASIKHRDQKTDRRTGGCLTVP